MSSTRDPLAAFDDETFETAASDAGLEVERLRTIARRHQETVRELPGVDDIVYEWRNQFHQDPLLDRTPAVYVLALRDHVWSEFGDRLEVSGDELAALRAVHDEQARRLIGDTDRLESDAAVVLTRP